MRGDSDIIVALYPHARGFAFVVLEGPFSPIDWGMSDVRVARRTEQCLRRLNLLIDHYRPEILVIRDMARAESAAELFTAIKQQADGRGVRTVKVSRKQIRRVFAHLAPLSRYAIAKTIAQDMPVFAPLLPPARRIWNGEDRRMGLFDAAALAVTYLDADPCSNPAAPDTTTLFGAPEALLGNL